MKIAILTNDLSGMNGWSKYGLDLGEELIKNDHEVLFITAKPSKRGFNERVLLNTSQRYLANPFSCIYTGRKVKGVLKDFRPDIVHAVVEPYGLILPWVGDYKKILTIHGTYSWMPALFRGMKKIISLYLSNKMFRDVTSVIAVSNLTKRHLEKNIGPTTFLSKVHVITNGTKIPVIASIKRDSEVKKILFVGMIKPRKGIKEAILGLSTFKNITETKFICEIVGKYSEHENYYQEVLQLVESLDLKDHVRLMGTISEEVLNKSYEEADIYLMTPIKDKNEFEGFGLVYLEAAARGVPSIGSKNSGAEEAILEGKSGYIVDPFSPQEIASAIKKILEDKTISSEDCLKWAKENRLENKVKAILDLYIK